MDFVLFVLISSLKENKQTNKMGQPVVLKKYIYLSEGGMCYLISSYVVVYSPAWGNFYL